METHQEFPKDVQRAIARKKPSVDRQGVLKYLIMDHMEGRGFEPSSLNHAENRMSSAGRPGLEVCSFKIYHPYYPEDKKMRLKFWFLGHPGDKHLAKSFAADQVRPPKLRKAKPRQPTYIDAAVGVSRVLPSVPCDVWWTIDLWRPWFISKKKKPMVWLLQYL
jgi:hypothetical protein